MKARMATYAAAFGMLAVLFGSSLSMQAFGHALNIQSIDVEGAGERGITIVIGHSNEPTFGAYPGIHDGKHNVEVFLEDRDTVLPLTGAELQIDKYYFEDIDSFNQADSPDDADEVEKGVPLSGVFGDPGHYVARQVTDDGIYGYRLYGTINYFSVAELDIDTTVFCREGEGGGSANTSKFNSPGWFGGFGCHDDIEGIFFPENLSNVNDGTSGGGGNATAIITVLSQLANGTEFEKWVEISDESGEIVHQDFTPVEFEGEIGQRYTIEIRFDQNPQFSQWQDGFDERTRTITLRNDTTLTAIFGDEANATGAEANTAATVGPVSAGQVQQVSLAPSSAAGSGTYATIASVSAQSPVGLAQLLTMLLVPAAGVVAVWRIRSHRQGKRDAAL